MKKDGILGRMKKERYASYESGLGAKIAVGTTSFEELEKHALGAKTPGQISAGQEKYESIFNSYC